MGILVECPKCKVRGSVKAGVSSDKTDFDGGWDLSLSNPNHVP